MAKSIDKISPRRMRKTVTFLYCSILVMHDVMIHYLRKCNLYLHETKKVTGVPTCITVKVPTSLHQNYIRSKSKVYISNKGNSFSLYTV